MSRRWMTQEHNIYQRSLRQYLTNQVLPHYDQWEQEGSIPRKIWLEMGEQGYLCPWLPEEYGGAGADFTYAIIVEEELGYSTCNGLGTGVRMHSDIGTPYIASLASEEMKKEILPGCASGEIILGLAMTEPGGGSDLAGMKTNARKDGEDFVINGAKTFITNGANCDWVILAVKTDPNVRPAHRGVSLVLVPKDAKGFSKGKPLHKMGLHSQDTAELFFDDCRVPQRFLMGQEGNGFRHLMQNLQQERLVVCVASIAMAEKILELTLDYVKTRSAFGQTIGSFQHNSFKLAEMATEVELGRVFVESLIEQHLEGVDITRRVSMGKWWLTEMLNRLAYQSVQLHGGYGYMEEYTISRMYRDVRVMTIVAGTTEIMKRIIARQMGL